MSTRFSVTVLAAGSLLASPVAVTGESVNTSSRALQHSLQAVGYSTVSGVQILSGAMAIPLGVSAQIGKVSGDLSDEMWEIANTPAGQPLPIADEPITAGPPPRAALGTTPGQEH